MLSAESDKSNLLKIIYTVFATDSKTRYLYINIHNNGVTKTRQIDFPTLQRYELFSADDPEKIRDGNKEGILAHARTKRQSIHALLFRKIERKSRRSFPNRFRNIMNAHCRQSDLVFQFADGDYVRQSSRVLHFVIL